MRGCDRVNFATFSPLFLSCGQKRVLNGGVSRVFASRRSGSRRSARGMPNVMAGIYSSFSANRDERHRPRSRECQLFSRLSVYFVEAVSPAGKKRARRKSNKNACGFVTLYNPK